MKRLFLLSATAAALLLGFPAAQACIGTAGVTADATSLSGSSQSTDLSAAKKKKKKAVRARRGGTGASKAGTGGGAGGEGGAGTASERQQGAPRGNPATPTR